LALPTDSSETFIREVEENYRRDRARDFFKTYGKWVIAGIVLFLGIVAGLIYWEEHSRKQSAEESVEMQKIFTDIGQGKTQTVPQRLQALEKSGADATRATAMLAEAAVALEKNDRSKALGKYRAM
jgi:predicted negative regulator of RcsB-dependent stress response